MLSMNVEGWRSVIVMIQFVLGCLVSFILCISALIVKKEYMFEDGRIRTGSL